MKKKEGTSKLDLLRDLREKQAIRLEKEKKDDTRDSGDTRPRRGRPRNVVNGDDGEK